VDVALVTADTFDYTARREEFVAWAEAAGAVTSLWNRPDVLRWNTHKGYLLELEDRGAPVVPTAWLAQGDRVSLRELRASRDWGRVIVKPAVASGSDGLFRTAPDDDDGPLGAGQAHLDALLADGDVMVQPYLPSVETEGEVSVVLIDGQVSHVVRKRPVAGEFRIQEQFGGRYERVALDGDGAEPAALARWIVEATGHELLIARVDLLRAEDGAWQLAELEVTEPDLYLGVAPEAAEPLAEAVLARA
jgi:glutathione synthase/RimK-type ligase-like ATP-grasp enzyme